jgi:hypothetical protein
MGRSELALSFISIAVEPHSVIDIHKIGFQ